MINPYDLMQAQCQLALLQAALVRYPALWYKTAQKSVLRDQSGQFASESSKRVARITGSPPSARVRTLKTGGFPTVNQFEEAVLTPITTAAGSSRYFTTEIDNQKYFLKRRDSSLFKDAAAKEELATEISKVMGIEKYVIPSKYVEIKRRDYSASPFVEGENLFEVDTPLTELINEKEITKLGLFDYVIANGDRNEGNFHITKEGLKLADHEATFSNMSDFDGELADAFRGISAKIKKEDIQAVVASEKDILAAIPKIVKDPDLVEMYSQVVESRLDTLKAIASSPDIGKAINTLM
jgi:hypothetical protein